MWGSLLLRFKYIHVIYIYIYYILYIDTVYICIYIYIYYSVVYITYTDEKKENVLIFLSAMEIQF